MAKIVMEQVLSEGLISGAARLADTLEAGCGPNGRNTICDQEYDIPLVTNAGRKVLQGFCLQEDMENIGAVLLREAALKTDHICGDGTATTAILTKALLYEGKKMVAAGSDPMRLRGGIKKAVPTVTRAILDAAVPAADRELVFRTAAAAADSEEIGRLAADAFEAVGPGGIVNVVDSQEPENRLEICGGIRYGRGFFSSSFINVPEKRSAALEQPYILVADQKLTHMKQIEKILNEVIRADASILLVVRDIEESVLNILLTNVHRKILRAVAVNGPGYGNSRKRNMRALAAKTGAMFIDEESGIDLNCCGLEVCGRAGCAVSDRDSTLIKGLWNEDRQAVERLKSQTAVLLSGAEEDYEADGLKETMGILSGSMATIIAGGVTEYEMFENKHQIENAVSAVYGAVRAGVVAGGGKGYLLAVPAVEQLAAQKEGEELSALHCIRAALLAPARCIADNAGDDGTYVVSMLLEHGDDSFRGYDASGHAFCDLRNAGILDSAFTLCTAFEIAAETAASLLTVSAAVTSGRVRISGGY